MKEKYKLVFFFILISSLSLVLLLNSSVDYQKEIKYPIGDSESDFYKLMPSDYTLLSPTVINDMGSGDYTFSEAAQESWCSGSGTENDPFIIENIKIDGEGTESALEIQDTEAYFIVRNCFFSNGSTLWEDSGILLVNVTNAIVENNILMSNGYHGILVTSCGENVLISNNTSIKNKIGINIDHTDNCTVTKNRIYNMSEFGINTYNCNNNTYTQNQVDNITTKNQWGISFFGKCSDNYVANNSIINVNEGDGIHFGRDCDENIAIGNNIKDVRNGILAYYSSKHLISRNTLFNCSEIGIQSYDNSSIIKNHISGGGEYVAIKLIQSANILSNNEIYDGNVGIEINSMENNITKNNIRGNQIGIKLNSGYNTITNNIIVNNNVDIDTGTTTNNIINGNTTTTTYLFSSILIMIIPGALVSLTLGLSVGRKRYKINNEATIKSIDKLKVKPKFLKSIESRKKEYNALNSRIVELKQLKQEKERELEKRIEKEEKKLMEKRLQERVKLQEEYDEVIESLNGIKTELEQEIQQKSTLNRNVSELINRKREINNKIQQMKKEHKKNLEQAKKRIEEEEQEWARHRAKMKQDLEKKWQLKMRKLEEEREVARNNLENQIKLTEERRVQLQKKSTLKEERNKIIDALEELDGSLYEDIEKIIIESKEKISNLTFLDSKNFTDEDKIDLVDKFDKIMNALENQQEFEQISDGIIGKLSNIDNQIRSLSSKMEMQRSAPVLTIPSKQTKTYFSTIKEMEFLCELCHEPIKIIEIKEKRKWIKWTLLGVKSIMNFTNFGFLTNLIPSLDLNGLKAPTENIADGGRLERLLDEITLERYELDPSLEEFVKDMNMEDQDEQDSDGLENSMIKYRTYFGNTVKNTYDLDDILELISAKEKVYWQLFSREEQEDIRTFLKENGHSDLYNSELQIRHGIFVCKRCRDWIDDLEEDRIMRGVSINE